MSSPARRARRAAQREADRRWRRRTPRATRVGLELARRGCDAVWQRDGIGPIVAVAVEGPGALWVVTIDPIDDGLDALDGAVGDLAHRLDRLRRLVAADAIVIAIAFDGTCSGGVLAADGDRDLALEDLDEIEAMAMSDDTSIGVTADA